MPSLDFIHGLMMLLNVFLLVILVPGGPIENRDFSKMSGFLFWGFNAFLIALGLASFFVGYLFFTGNAAITSGIFLATLYLGVYVMDLVGLFPKSPDKMSSVLRLCETVNACVAIITMMVYAYSVL